MILKVIDETGAIIAAIQVYENNYDGVVSVMDTYHCKAVENGFDKVFGTNDQEVAIQFDHNLKRNFVADEIVADIVSQRVGQVYDDEILCEFVDDYFANELGLIRTIVDEMMRDYLEEDNLTVKR